MKKVWLIVALVLAVGFGLGWQFGSPGYAVTGLRDALVAGNRDELNARIDFPAVRDSLKAQVSAVIMQEMSAKMENNPFAAMGNMIAMNMVNGIIDNLVTPDGIRAMVQQGHFNDPQKPAPAIDPNAKPVDWMIQRETFDRFVASRAEDADHSPKLIFKRNGLSWKLVDIQMPPKQ